MNTGFSHPPSHDPRLVYVIPKGSRGRCNLGEKGLHRSYLNELKATKSKNRKKQKNHTL